MTKFRQSLYFMAIGACVSLQTALGDLEGVIPSSPGSDWAPFYYNSSGVRPDQLGDAVAMSDDWFIIGESEGDGPISNTGTAWVLSWNDGSQAFGNPVDLGSLVPASEIVSQSSFGAAVDVDGVYAVVGAPTCNMEGTFSGRAYLFEYSEGEWTYRHTFDDGAAGSEFGIAVDIDGRSVAIGEPGETSDAGYVNLYEIVDGLDSGVVSVGGLQPQRGSTPRFGEALDRDRDLLVIGAPGISGSIGYAAIYENLSDGSYVFDSFLNPPADLDDSLSKFGAAVAISNNTAVVGAPWPEGGAEDHGGVVVFDQEADSSWVASARLDNDETASSIRFGQAVDIHEDLIIVGIPADNPAGNGSGSARIFRYSPTSSFWVLEHHLLGWDVTSGDQYGDDVAAGPHGVGVGVPFYNVGFTGNESGVAFIYRQMSWDDDNWQHDMRQIQPCLGSDQIIRNPEIDADTASFGLDIALDSNTAIVGDPYYRNDDGDPSGIVRFYTRSTVDSDWVLLSGKDVDLPEPIDAWEQFGASVDIEGDFAIIGAPGHDSDTGRVIIMQRQGSSWVEVDVIGDDVTGALFGFDVAVDVAFGQTYFIVGAPTSYSTAGIVRVYQWDDGDQYAKELFSVLDPQWSGTATSRFGEAVDINVTNTDQIRFAVGNPWQFGPDGYGSISIFDANDTGFAWIYGNYTNSLPYSDQFALEGGFCATNIDLDDDLLIVSMPQSTDLYYEQGGAVIYEGNDLTGNGVLDWSFSYLLSLDLPGNGDLAGHDVAIDASSGIAVIGVPGLDYTGVNSGAVAPFRFDGFDWRTDMMLISSVPQPGVAIGKSVSLDGTSLLAGGPGLDITESPSFTTRALSWELVERTSYQDIDGGSMASDNAWTGGVGGAGHALFSLWLADPYVVPFDIDQWLGSIQVELDQITFNLMSGERSVSDSMEIAGATDIKSASVTLEAGTLTIEENMTVGQENGYGQINVGNYGFLEVVQTLNLTEDSGTSIILDGSADPKIITYVQPPAINGTMQVQIGSSMDVEDFVEGTRIVLISAGVTPTTNALDALVLPGLSEGLAFQVTYGDPDSRSMGGGCVGGEIEDCFGNCCPATWIGDGFCDDGSYDYDGFDIYLNCEALGCDGGDCKSCWSEGGTWEMAIEVVSLAGLLNFGDPNSVLVEGEPTALEVVDLTNDGAEEICVTFAGSPGQLYIFENDGAGGIAQQIVLATGDQPVDITSGDFDGDGRTDLAVANNLGQSVDIYYNDDNDVSNGFNLLNPSLAVDAPPTCLAGVDVDLDDIDDLVVGLEDIDGNGNGFWAIYIGNSALRGAGMSSGGGLEPSGTPLGIDPSEEEDQKEMLFVGRTDDGKANVGKREAATTGVSLTIDEYVVGADPGGIALGDFDDDGLTDIAITSTLNGTVGILLQDAGGTADFLPVTQIPLGDEPTGITSVDFDSDGNLDLAIIVIETDLAGITTPVVRVLQNDGSLTFTSTDVAENEDVALVDNGDISGNGTSELVTIGSGGAFRRGGASPLLSLRELESAPDCIGDADGNSTVNVKDLLAVLSEFGRCTSGCNGDFDSDDDVDINDLLALISNWGPCGKD
ncbi:MAG: hypothetical protein CMJ29_01565 [Phycisphaerae bacterium]|nr:hypothetical protein [Phycisphaerae bacterium]